LKAGRSILCASMVFYTFLWIVLDALISISAIHFG
jgi:hypothetical protein